MRHEFAGDLFALASAQMAELKHRVVMANGIRIHLAKAGKGPFVLMVHGFPESWLSNLC